MKLNTNDLKRRTCTLSENMQVLMIRQLGSELANHNLYKTFSNFFSTYGLEKLANYYSLRAEEEKEHHDWVFNYLNATDTPFEYPVIEPVIFSDDNLVEPFEKTVDVEIETTKMLYEMVSLAQEEKDWNTFEFLMGDDPEFGKLIKEQREEESTSRTALDIAASDASWLQKERAIMSMYVQNTED